MSLFLGESSYEEPEYTIINTPSILTKIMGNIYGEMKPPHLLPRFFLDKIVLQEVAYQTIIHGVIGMVYRSKKSIWPPLPL